MIPNVIDISSRKPLVPAEPDVVEAAPDVTPQNEREQRIYWSAYRAGWADCRDDEDQAAAEVLAKTQRFMDQRMGVSRPRLFPVS